MAWNIARAKRPYLDDQFAKNIVADVVGVLDPENKKLQKHIATAETSETYITERRIFQIRADIGATMQNDLFPKLTKFLFIQSGF